MNPDKNAIILKQKQALFDVTDKSLYSFNDWNFQCPYCRRTPGYAWI
jgi:hypothetical protein